MPPPLTVSETTTNNSNKREDAGWVRSHAFRMSSTNNLNKNHQHQMRLSRNLQGNNQPNTSHVPSTDVDTSPRSVACRSPSVAWVNRSRCHSIAEPGGKLELFCLGPATENVIRSSSNSGCLDFTVIIPHWILGATRWILDATFAIVMNVRPSQVSKS